MRPCPFCHIAVASHDSERIQVGTDVFHGKCHREKRKQESVTFNCHRGKASIAAYQLTLNLSPAVSVQ